MIKGVYIKELQKYEDARGWLCEIYRDDEVNYKTKNESGQEQDYRPTMSYVSVTKPNIARGPHEHIRQSDLFVFMGPGKFRVYLWDNRKDSETFGEHQELEAGEDRPLFLIVPPGVVHGYKCISENDAWSINLPDKLYKGWGKTEEVDEVRWENDPNSPFKIE